MVAAQADHYLGRGVGGGVEPNRFEPALVMGGVDEGGEMIEASSQVQGTPRQVAGTIDLTEPPKNEGKVVECRHAEALAETEGRLRFADDLADRDRLLEVNTGADEIAA